MADLTIMQTLYSKEWVQAYEQKQSILRGTVSTEGEVKGDTFVFIIEGAADEAVERGANGNIPYAQDNQSSTSATLKDYHHLVRKNEFNIATSSVNQRLSMQRRGVVAANKKTDALLLAQMATTTVNTGAAAGNSLSLMLAAVEKLNAAYVPDDGERYGLLTPRAWGLAMKVNQFSSGDWVSDKPYMKTSMWRSWMNVKWTMHPSLPGVTTNSASCFIYHKGSVGHALNGGAMRSEIGRNGEHDYSWARTSTSQGAKLLQTAGVVKMVHDDTTAL